MSWECRLHTLCAFLSLEVLGACTRVSFLLLSCTGSLAYNVLTACMQSTLYACDQARQPRLMYWASYWEEWFMTRLLGSWLPKQWADFIWLKLFQSKFAAQKGLDK